MECPVRQFCESIRNPWLPPQLPRRKHNDRPVVSGYRDHKGWPSMVHFLVYQVRQFGDTRLPWPPTRPPCRVSGKIHDHIRQQTCTGGSTAARMAHDHIVEDLSIVKEATRGVRPTTPAKQATRTPHDTINTRSRMRNIIQALLPISSQATKRKTIHTRPPQYASVLQPQRLSPRPILPWKASNTAVGAAV